MSSERGIASLPSSFGHPEASLRGSKSIIANPLQWPVGEAVAVGSGSTIDAGNVHTTVIGNTHYLSFYSGKAPGTAVLVSVLPAPKGVEKHASGEGK